LTIFLCEIYLILCFYHKDNDEADADDKLDEEEKNDSNGFLLGARRKLKLHAEEG